ncbi:MAG TPA: hypothetical protein VFY00_04120 [Arenimonas sp.]|nr:hypothetical protein [Arenimonas sp.]
MTATAGQRRPRAGQGGFVLALVLWLLAAIAIVAGLLTLWALDQVTDAQSDRLGTEQRLAMLGTRDTLIYLAATRDKTVAGLPVEALNEEQRALLSLEEFGAFSRDAIGGELPLDGSVHEGLQGIRFAVQDEAGLLSVAWPSAAYLDRLLAAWQVDEGEAPRLRDALLDYIDHDDLRHLNGAEDRDYERADRSPPPNRRLLAPVELERVLGWDERSGLGHDVASEQATTYYAGPLNLNTAPPGILSLVIPGCPATCEILLESRRETPLRSSSEVQALLGVVLPGDPLTDYRYAPSDELRLTLWGDSGAAWRIHIRLTPMANGQAPWVFLAAYQVTRPETDDPPRTIDHALFADQATGRP